MKILNNGIAIIEGDTHISRWVEQSGQLDHDQNTLPLLTKYIPRGGTVVDIGAFIGDHTLHYAICVGLTGSVIAIEPNPAAFKCLRHNMAAHRQVTCLHVGASDRPHTIGINTDINAGASHATAQGGIPCITLDSLYLARCDFMKLDCEGYEVRALEGAVNTIRHHRPVLLIEVNIGALERQGVSDWDIYAFLKALGYTARNLFPGTPMAGAQYDIICTP